MEDFESEQKDKSRFKQWTAKETIQEDAKVKAGPRLTCHSRQQDVAHKRHSLTEVHLVRWRLRHQDLHIHGEQTRHKAVR